MIRRCMTLLLEKACTAAFSFSLNSTRISGYRPDGWWFYVCHSCDRCCDIHVQLLLEHWYALVVSIIWSSRLWISHLFKKNTRKCAKCKTFWRVRHLCDEMLENTVIRSVSFFKKFVIVKKLWIYQIIWKRLKCLVCVCASLV